MGRKKLIIIIGIVVLIILIVLATFLILKRNKEEKLILNQAEKYLTNYYTYSYKEIEKYWSSLKEYTDPGYYEALKSSAMFPATQKEVPKNLIENKGWVETEKLEFLEQVGDSAKVRAEIKEMRSDVRYTTNPLISPDILEITLKKENNKWVVFEVTYLPSVSE